MSQRYWDEHISWNIEIRLVNFPPAFEGALICYIHDYFAVYGYVEGNSLDGWVGSWSDEVISILEEEGSVEVDFRRILRTSCEFEAVIWGAIPRLQ
jgi:hypothetical protein